MKLQVVLPNETAGTDPRRLVDLARQAEALGYDTAWLPDHILPPGEYGPVSAAAGLLRRRDPTGRSPLSFS